GLWKYTGLWDLKNITGAVIVSSSAFFLLVTFGFGRNDYPLSVILIDALLLLVMLGGIRLTRRIFRGIRLPQKGRRVLIVGAGDAGEMIVRDMLRRGESFYVPVAFVDDDSAKVGQRIHGIRVVGTCQDLPKAMEMFHPEEVLLAIPRADSSVRRRIVQALQSWNVPIKTLPSVGELLECKVGVTQIRPLAIEDLLGRDPVHMETERVRELVAGKRVLVTGAGGSIGSELCRQIIAFNPRELVLYDRYENGLHSIQTELQNLVGAPPVHPVIGDVTDRDRFEDIMARHRPQLVFHAAAHKHVPLMEMNSCEAIKNNVLGTQTVAVSADRFGVERFVLISTDKAVNPTSVMGATKRVAELVVQNMAKRSKTYFTIVRFGNVLGSNGSVVLAFKAQIQEGGPVTVTHPEMRRYFMLIPEAVHLVLQAATLGEQGALYVLEMGEQVKVIDLARNLIRLSGFIPEVEIPISFVGLRPGEKLYEELVGADEKVEPSSVDKIYRVQNGQQPESKYLLKKIREFEEASALKDPFFVIEWLQEIVPTFHPTEIKTRVTSPSPMIETAVTAR
ncbi:MAG: polysaccharide biosynthesis protein, partial [Nitrospinae bacterium]|nr:polysaccharide biosynthesis protein [Nitrospinota bacterium]